MKKTKKKRLIKGNHLLEDEVITLSRSKGNGILKRQIWTDDDGAVTRYSLTYINHHLHNADNGRVLGYDNAHGYHHRHYFGKVEPITFNSFMEIENKFQQEFEVLHEKIKKK